MANKKGDVWVSAVLYFGLGIIIISILLAAGLPVINRLKDKNIAIQTKESFHKIDENIREVIRGGPGTQRVLTIEIKKGELKFSFNKVLWEYNSKVYLSEPTDDCKLDNNNELSDKCIIVPEGNMKIATAKSAQKGSYNLYYSLDYGTLANINSEIQTIKGVNDIVIRNDGLDTDNKLKITIASP